MKSVQKGFHILLANKFPFYNLSMFLKTYSIIF